MTEDRDALRRRANLMRSVVETALKTSATWPIAGDMARDAFIIARVNANASACDVDIRIHWNWFVLGWNAAHIWFKTIASEGSH